MEKDPGLSFQEGRSDLREAHDRVRSALVDIENQLTASPVDLPHRNTLRALLAAANQLVAGSGTQYARANEFRARIAQVLEQHEL